MIDFSSQLIQESLNTWWEKDNNTISDEQEDELQLTNTSLGDSTESVLKWIIIQCHLSGEYLCKVSNDVGEGEACPLEITGSSNISFRFEIINIDCFADVIFTKSLTENDLIIILAVAAAVFALLLIICIVVCIRCSKSKAQPEKGNLVKSVTIKSSFTFQSCIIDLESYIYNTCWSSKKCSLVSANGKESDKGDIAPHPDKSFYENLPFHGLKQPPKEVSQHLMHENF